MLKLSYPALKPGSERYLSNLQEKVDAELSRESQYAVACKLFRNKTAKAWQDVREKLSAIAPGGDSCFYCERDRYRDIEHIFPKRHYPSRAFDWSNYVYACVVCNQDRKGDKFACIEGGAIIRFDRTWPYQTEIPGGTPALINLRSEDPLEFFMLDLETGIFVEIGDAETQMRAQFTIELFDLNGGELPRHRARASITYRDYLDRWFDAYKKGDKSLLDALEAELISLPYPTVLAEMRRQSPAYANFAEIFALLPAHIGKY